ncbi:MAG: hypothetical protein K0Q87_1698, partial [Neobacillus sp.]|nr:hypothetical protein [Neobacillus sp.]
IEEITGDRAILLIDGSPSPYNLPGSWSVNTNRARSLGYAFIKLEDLLKQLIVHYS